MAEENVVPFGSKGAKTFRRLSDDPRIEVLFFSKVTKAMEPSSFRASMARLEGAGAGKSAIVLQDGTTITLTLPYAQLTAIIDGGSSPIDLKEYCEAVVPAAEPWVGTTIADGSVFAGVTADGSQRIYAMPRDLDVAMTFNDAAKAVKKLNSQRALGHDDWQIPALDKLRVLYSNQNEGALKGTFNMSGNKGIGSVSPVWYWSSTEHRDHPSYVWNVRFSDGYEGWSPKDNGRLSCRPVRLVACEAPPSASHSAPAPR
jgi:hypothetical protein